MKYINKFTIASLICIGKIIKRYFDNEYLTICMLLDIKIDKNEILKQIENQIGPLRDGFPEFAKKGITLDQALKDKNYIESHWPDDHKIQEIKEFWESL